MEIIEKIKNELEKIIAKDRLLINENMKKYSSFNIGGSVDIMIKIANEKELIATLQVLKTHNLPYMIIGKCSNMIIRDEGIRGAVIQLGQDFSALEIKGNTVKAQSGISLRNLAERCAKKELGNLEFAHGIPGNLGGAITMNAGAYGGEMKDVIKTVRILDKNLNIKELTNEEMGFGYRQSVVQKEDYIVLEASFELETRAKDEIYAKMEDLMARRKAKQPLNYPSCGSVFKRPEGYYAGALIEEAGLKGLRYGGAMVSDKHAGFIVNTGSATSKDVITLIQIVQKCVFDRSKVLLEREVKLI